MSDITQYIHGDSHQDQEEETDLNHQDESINEDPDKATSIEEHDPQSNPTNKECMEEHDNSEYEGTMKVQVHDKEPNDASNLI